MSVILNAAGSSDIAGCLRAPCPPMLHLPNAFLVAQPLAAPPMVPLVAGAPLAAHLGSPYLLGRLLTQAPTRAAAVWHLLGLA